MPRYQVTISHGSMQAMQDLVRAHNINVEDHGQRRREGGGYSVQAQATPEEITRLRSAGYTVEQGRDLEAHELAMRDEVGKGNRYKKPR